jgi:Helix-turn-helix domain
MTPIPRPYNNWDAVSRVMATIPAMLAEGNYTPSRALVLITIAGHCNQQSGVALASYETFLNEAGIPRSTVKRTLKMLAEAGYVEHVKGTFAYRLGPQVQTFIEEKDKTGAKRYSNTPQTTATAPQTSNLNKLLGIK